MNGFRVFCLMSLLGSPALLMSQVSKTCGAADPAYILTAVETGGIPMFLQRSEAGQAFHLVRESTKNNVSTALWMDGSLNSQPQIAIVPVDSMIQSITFAVSFDSEGSSMSIQAPSGSVVRSNSGNTEITELRCGSIVTVVSPEKGEWHLDLSGKGRFWLEAKAQSEIHLVRVEFVRTGGRPGHEGYFRIDGQPDAGKPATVRVSLLTSSARSVQFHLAGERGEVLQAAQLQSADSAEEFIGTLIVPSIPFRMVITGLDANGWPYQRFYAPLFHADSAPAGSNR